MNCLGPGSLWGGWRFVGCGGPARGLDYDSQVDYLYIAREITDPDASDQWLRRTATDTPPPAPPAAGLHALTHAPRRGAAPAAAMASHMPAVLSSLRRGPEVTVVSYDGTGPH